MVACRAAGGLSSSLVAVVVAISTWAASGCEKEQCRYGELPGYYRNGVWQLADACCALQDHVGAALGIPLNSSSSSKTPPDTAILIFGDSVDRITLHDLCEQGQYENWGHELGTFHTCRRGGLLLARQSMIGVHPVPHFNLSGSPFQRVDNGFAQHAEVAGRPPDAVVYSSVLWDLQHWALLTPDALAGTELPPAALDEWAGNFAALLRYIKERPPATLHIYKTTVPPLARDCAAPDGAFARADLGRKPHVLALNAVARRVAAEQGWATVNMEALVAPFSDREYLRDYHHPSKPVSLTALNIVLNLVYSKDNV